MNIHFDHLDFPFLSKGSWLQERTKNDSQCHFFHICVCTTGTFEIKINQQIHQVIPHGIAFIRPGDHFEFGSKSEDVNGWMISFTKESLIDDNFYASQFDTLPMIQSLAVSCIHATENEARLLFKICDLIEYSSNSQNLRFESALIKNLIWAFLFETASVYNRLQNTSSLRASREMVLNVKFQQLLIKNARLRHNLKYYADLLFISPKYLIHVIKKATGKTPGEIINEALVFNAKRELEDVNRPIGIIADELNFGDQASFSKFFKRQTGFSPLSYRYRLSEFGEPETLLSMTS